jgi:ABC-type amino acid transport substrate-binding protein
VKKGGNPKLLAKSNDGLKKIIDNGELDKIIKKYVSK